MNYGDKNQLINHYEQYANGKNKTKPELYISILEELN